jgi:glycosyltransferase involved in cell wall biosynthesis
MTKDKSLLFNSSSSSVTISVIMPIYNAEKYLRMQLDSILIQTFSEFELIIVDDSSKDSSLDIVLEYSGLDSRIKIFNNEFSKGIAGALNTGLKYAIGEFIARCDGDDITKKDRFKLQHDFFQKNPNIHILGGCADLFNNSGFIRKSVYPESSLYLAWKSISNTYFCHPSVMFRSIIYKEIGGYPIEKSEDFAYFSKILKRYRGANLSQSLLEYRVHDQSYSNQEVSHINDSVKSRFYKNFEYYVPGLNLVDEFRLFQEQKILRFQHLFQILMINTKIIDRIRKDYNLEVFNWEFLSILVVQVFWLFYSVFNLYFVFIKNLLYKFKIRFFNKKLAKNNF